MRATHADAEQWAAGWGHRFTDVSLLTQALTHTSYAHEHPQAGPSYERLEFVGDAVLGLISAAYLQTQQPDADEGALSRQRAALVRRESLAALGTALQLGPWLRLGVSQQQAAGQANLRILADSYEALVGAVFLDAGYVAAQAVFLPQLRAALLGDALLSDGKTQLQELCHRRGLPRPLYRVLQVEGPDHRRVYLCDVQVGASWRAEARGANKRAAEQRCAHDVLGRLRAPTARKGSADAVPLP